MKRNETCLMTREGADHLPQRKAQGVDPTRAHGVTRRVSKSVYCARVVSGHRQLWSRAVEHFDRPLLAAFWLGLAAVGCGDPLMERGLLEGPRVLGARVEVAGEPSLSWPAPGEDVTMSFLVAEPEKSAEVTWALSVCEAEPVVRDSPTCAAPPFAQMVTEEPSAELPSFSFAVPEERELLGSDSLLVAGAFCFDSETRAPSDVDDFAGYRCTSGQKPNLVSMDIDVSRDGEVNHNPDLDAAELSFDGEPWGTVPLVGADLFHGCDEVPFELARIDAGSKAHVIALTMPTGQREALAQTSSRAQSRETLQLSHVVSAGDLERSFSVIDDQSPGSELTLNWDAPHDVPDEGLVVRFFFVVRDLRGGVDFRMTALCVEPGSA